jgi:dTDP-L-rhamnose 4-epimerase
MRVLVTGGAGFIGSHTVDMLLQKGYAVRVMDALVPPVHEPARLPGYVPAGDVEITRADVRDRAAWASALEGIDAVYHLAAYQDYLPDFSTFFHTNDVGTALLYEIIVEERLPVQRVIVASSQAAYGEGKYVCKRVAGASSPADSSHGVQYPAPRGESQLRKGEWDVRCPECGAAMEPQATDESVVSPHTSYAISKYTQEMIALSLGRRYGIATVCLRYSIVQGPRQAFRNAYSGVLRIFTQQLLAGKPAVCYEDGQQLRDYVSVHDVARANVLVLEDERAAFQVFNVGGDHRVSVIDYARMIARRAGVDLEPRLPGIYRLGDTRHIFSDSMRLKSLGWRPSVPLERIVDEYIAWAQSQPGFRDYSAEAEARMASLGTIRRVG